MADLPLDARSKTNLAKHLEALEEIPELDPDRLRDLKMCATNHVTLEELAHISDALFPLPLCNAIMNTSYCVRRVA